jgi:uncharacterized membrane protein YhiD involved in acid resistance
VLEFERQWRQRLAGLRTKTPVALGAASFVVFETLFSTEANLTGTERARAKYGRDSLRAMLLQGLGAGGIHLRRLDSSNIEDSDRVEVFAVLSADRRSDGVLEQIVGRLSLEPSVTAARWRVETVAE